MLAGTSAGASAMATHMMAFGRAGETPKQRMAQLAAGLGILQGVVVDQHFEQRGRFGRLLAVIAQSPSLLGIGLDEDTSAIVYADRSMEVVGRGAVTVLDGSRVADRRATRPRRPPADHDLGSGGALAARRLLVRPPQRERCWPEAPGMEREASE